MAAVEGYLPSDTEPERAFRNQHGLRIALAAVLPDLEPDDRKKNPLNLLLPGYETLSRIVLRCFTELTARNHANTPSWCKVLQAFAANPTADQQLLISGVGTSISASQITKENLRLYPPIRRVYREYISTDGGVKTTAADVENCHRYSGFWTPDPPDFRPKRWNGMETKEQEAPCSCPSARSHLPVQQRDAMGSRCHLVCE